MTDNAAQAAEWDGPIGEHWAKHADVFETELDGYGRLLRAAANIEETHRVLDIGCGTGKSTRDAARVAVSGSAHGVDLSTRMLEVARRRAAEEGLGNVTFEQADAQLHPFPAARFDLAISRFGSMFFADPVAAFANIGRALRPGARLAMAVWQDRDRQEWSRTVRESLLPGRTVPPPAGPGPASLADPDTVRRILGSAGYHHVECADVREPVSYGSDAATATAVVLGMRSTKDLLAQLEPAEVEPALDRLRAALTANQTDEGVRFDSRAWIVTAIR
ncbi:MAG TPA: class I SAM-dependent methyltransferase [Actinophytocola sp.]|jgi:SAM-dependent methyltransferase|uniref:class I SAM-dependent methyltransferase n=1 Tax=Actinophytocola sp. TaxID=1872138 RepID=UPI002E0152F7|nr:class I SAM-dependent methyltransferase [Actinophytocola sp.]